MPPAARLTDLTACLGNPLVPGPPSPNVLIGKLPAWLGMTAAAAAALAKTLKEETEKVLEAEAAAKLATGTPGQGAAELKVVDQKAEMVKNVCAAMTGGGSLSIKICALLPPPHVQGVVIKPSQTVIINKWGACRVGDPIQEVTFMSAIAKGEMTVMIGG